MQKIDITIVGAGLAGTTSAALLAQSGFQVCLIDHADFAQWQANNNIIRVSAFNQAAKRIFSHLQIWPDIEKYACPFNTMHIWQDNGLDNGLVNKPGNRPNQITFDSVKQGYANFAHIIENDLVTSSLISRLSQQGNVTLLPNTTITAFEDNNQLLSLSNGQQIRTKLVIGADGANSQVRRQAGIALDRLEFRQRAIVANISLKQHNAKESARAWQCFMPTGPLALLPLYNGQYSIVWSCQQAHYESLAQLSDDDFIAALNAIIKDKLPNVESVSKRFAFNITQQHAKHYHANNIRLIGDAAHTTHPLAGIGANLGLLDAACLAQILSQAKQSQRDITKTSLANQYQRWRRGENMLALNTMRAFNFGFTQHNPIISGLSGLALNLTDNIDLLKARFSQIAMGNVGDLPDICRDRI